MKNVNEVSKLSGVSIRTLHYYDEIGLLNPTKRTAKGYRLYDDNALIKLKTILLYKELKFPLSTIKQIINSPTFAAEEAIKQQVEILKLQIEHYENLITLANNMLKEKNVMDFKAFDNSVLKEYEDEAKQRWGKTKEYAEYNSKKGKNNYSKDLMEKFAYLGKIKNLPIENEEVKKAVFDIKDFISTNYYNCSNEMFVNLGQMYICDERFRQNIDSVGGEGTAEFAKKAIDYYFTK